MKRFVTTLAAVALLTACFDDPTSSLRGGPSQIRLSRSVAFLNPGTSVVVEATLLDQQGNVLPGVVSFSTADTSVATAADVDTIEGLTETSGEITGVAAGATYVRATGGGLTDSIFVVVVPTTFPGTFSAATTTIGNTISVTASGIFSFDTATAAVIIDGAPALLLSKSSTELTFAPTVTTDGLVHVEGLVVLGNIAIGGLDASTTLTVTDPSEPTNDGPPGPSITMPAAGSSTVVYGAVDGDGVASSATGDYDDFFTLTATTADSVEITLDWANSAIDIDLIPLTTAFACVPAGCPGATGDDPEVVRARLAAGTTYYILVELWDNHGEVTPAPYRLTVRKIN